MQQQVVEIKNRLIMAGDKKEIAKFLRAIRNEANGQLIDFEKIVPYPNDIYLGPITADALQEHGENNWYDFNRRFWGTYYNAYDTEQFGNMLDFKTAWRPPIRVIKKMALMFPNIIFTFKYASSQAGAQVGAITICGEDMTWHQSVSSPEESAKLYKSLWPSRNATRLSS